jgi:TonB-linked SusC/RagA family outer membrane protein
LLTSQQEYDLLKELNAGNDAFFNIFSDYNFNDRENPANSRIDTVNWADINWQDEIMQNSTFQEYSLQLTGGGDKTKYLVSALYRNNEGTIKTAKSDQYVFRINLTNQVARSLEITSNFNLSRKVMNPVADNTQGWNGALINAAFTYPNFIPIYDPDVPDEFFVNPIRPQFDNPDAWIRGKQQESNRLSLNGLLQIKWEILKSLTFLSRNSLSYGSSNSSVWLSKYDTYVGRNAQGMYTIRFSEGMGIGTQNTLTWMQDFGGHSLSVMAGMEVGKGKGRGSSVTGMNFTNDLIREITAATDISGYSNHSQDFNAAYFGRINYAYRGKYLAQFNFRADGSAKFGENNRWAQFPSGSVAWKISEEPFFKKNVKAVNFLKLRFSYGLSGNKPPYNFMYMALYGLEAHGWEDAAYPVTLTDDLYPGYAIMRMENNDLRWETTTEYNVGLDMNMFKNRIVMNIDLYSRTANDLLYIYEPPVTFYDYSEQGGSLGGLLMNIGSTLNNGIEVALETKNMVNRFKWSTSVTFAYNHNEVKDLGKNPSINFDNEQVVAPGYPLYAFWGYQVDRLFQQDDFDEHGNLKEGIPYQPNVAPGDIKFRNNNGDDRIDKDDKVYLGNPTPPVTYSMSNDFAFANFDLTIFLQGVQGNKIWNKTRVSTEAMINNLISMSYSTPDGDIETDLKLDPRYEYASEVMHRIVELNFGASERCPGCGSPLCGSPRGESECERRQVVEYIPAHFEVVEYRAERIRCPGCGGTATKPFPDGVAAPVQYGPLFRATVLYANKYQLIPFARLADFFEDTAGRRVSAGTLWRISSSKACLSTTTRPKGICAWRNSAKKSAASSEA